VTSVFLLAEYGPEQYHSGSAFIRLIQPLSHSRIRQEHDVQIGVELPDRNVDTVITQRVWGSHRTIQDVRTLIRRIKRLAGWFIYELDDNLLDLSCDEISEEQRAIVRLFLREADAVMLSTAPLEARVRHLCKRTFVVPNAIDESLFPPAETILRAIAARSEEKKVVTFGYMGTPTHTQDLMMILEPLRGILRTYRDRIQFQIAQATHDPGIRMALDGLPYTIMDVSSGYYPDFIQWEAKNMNWDFGIAPLTDCPLNRSKSDLKFIEYGILGIPGIYSAGPSYSESVEHLRTGLVCLSDPQSWYDSFRLMIEDAPLRRKLAENALRHVHACRTVTESIDDWRTVLASASDRARFRAET